MPRLAPVARPGLLARLAYRTARRRYGAVPEPLTLWAHSPRLMLSVAAFEEAVARWGRLDPACSALAVLRSAQVVGCSWCTDFGPFVSRDVLTDAQVRDVDRWRDSDVYDEAQRLCLEYAEGASTTPLTVTDDLVARLVAVLGEPAVVELAMVVAVENQRSRFNGGLGLVSQGFLDGSCRVPG